MLASIRYLAILRLQPDLSFRKTLTFAQMDDLANYKDLCALGSRA